MMPLRACPRLKAHGKKPNAGLNAACLPPTWPRKVCHARLIASDFRVGFQVAQISEPSARMVGRNKSSDRLVSICASSIQQTFTASKT